MSQGQGVLFLCKTNACRSQIAEGLARHFLPPQTEILSAGTVPSEVHAGAREAMRDVGLGIDGQYAKGIDSIPLDRIGKIITLCDDTAEHCPKVPGARHEHWPVDDPVFMAGGGCRQLKSAFESVVDTVAMRMSQLASTMLVEPAVGVIGGSGFYDLPGLSDVQEVHVDTPFGAPSDTLVLGRLGARRLVFLPRHGRYHTLLPSEVNARANIYAFKRLGVTRLISVTAVGSLREHIAPGDVVLAHQFIDRTEGSRPRSYFGDGVVAHVSLADPVCLRTSKVLATAAHAVTHGTHIGGTYVCIEGPQFSTRAESELMRAWGANLVGMTALPEARLAREAEICYAPVCMPTDYDCWHPSESAVEVDDVIATLRANVQTGRQIIASALAQIEPAQPCSCHTSLDTALLTQPEHIGRVARLRLNSVLARRLGSMTTAD